MNNYSFILQDRSIVELSCFCFRRQREIQSFAVVERTRDEKFILTTAEDLFMTTANPIIELRQSSNGSTVICRAQVVSQVKRRKLLLVLISANAVEQRRQFHRVDSEINFRSAQNSDEIQRLNFSLERLNISGGGLGLCLPNQIESKTLCIDFLIQGKLLELHGKVVRQARKHNLYFDVGLEFSEARAEHQNELVKLCTDVARQKIQLAWSYLEETELDSEILKLPAVYSEPAHHIGLSS